MQSPFQSRSLSPFESQSGGGPAPEPITFSVLDPHNTITSRTVTAPATISQGSPIFGTNGASAVAMGGAFGQNGVQLASLSFPAFGANDLIMFAVDPPADPVNGELSNCNLTINASYAYRNDPADEPGVGGSGAKHGARWFSASVASMRTGSWAGATLDTLGAGNYQSRPIPTYTNLVGAGTSRVGPLIRVTQKRKPIICSTHDDNNDGHLIVNNMMKSRFGFSWGTSYIATGLIAVGARLTLSDMATMRADGWAFGLDSGPLDEPIWGAHGGTVADAIASLNAERDALVATGRATFLEASHICYSYGSQSSYPEQVVQQVTNATCNGTTTVTRPSGTFFDIGAMRGAIVKGVGVPAGTTVVNCPAGNTLIVSQPITSGTNVTLTFCGVFATSGAAGNLTADGSAVITGINSLGIAPGMVMNGRDVPGGTTVVSVDVESATIGQITVSQNVPATCTRGAFYVSGGEWLPGRVEDALIAANFKSARRTKATGGLCTQLGIPSPEAMMSFWACDFEGNNPAVSVPSTTIIGAIRQNIRDGRDTIGLAHAVNTFDQVGFGAVLDYIKSRVDAGEVDVMTVPAWYNRVAARSGV
jgi:hypothetical protein